MDIRKTYQELLQANLTLKDINQINDLKKQCRRENNQEFYYLSNLLIIDIYIEEKMYDEALKLAIEDLNKIDSSIFKNIYLYLLERIIYIYIQKGNYKSAYRYVYIKKNVIDLDNKEEVNRWYLEMSYVYAELNELNRALMYLQAILENYPSEEIKNIALSNMTKIYIDQGMIKEAKETLNQCLEGVLTANDEDGKLYCDYLLAKICILENNFQFAKQIYEELFKNQNQLPTEYLNLVNEYISLLIKMNELDEAEKIIKQYEKKFQEANIYIQKEFYKNKVKVASFKNSLVRDELNKILEMIDILDKEIASSKELVLYEAAEDEKNEEIQQSLKRTINKIEHTIDIITYALNQDDIRASLMNYSKRLEELLPYDEALFVIFEPKHYELMPNFFDHLSEFSSYQYKKDRLYERSHPYQSLTDTPIEIIMQNTNELIIDFTDTFVPLKNLITNRNYDSNTISSLVAIPFFHNKEIFGVVIYTSYNNLTTNENILILKIASKLLEFKLSSLFYQEDLRMQRNILQTAINCLHEGLFYLDPVNRKILLTEQFQKFLKTERRIISIEEYLTYIYPNDQKNYLETINQAFNRGEGYQIKYRIIINDEVNYVQEISNPYFLSNGTLSFFVGTINKIPYELTNEKIYLDKNEFKQKISQLNQKITNLEYKFSLIRVKITNLGQYNLPLPTILNYVSKTILDNFASENENIYCLDDNTLIFELKNCNDQRTIDRYIKACKRALEKTIIDNKVYSFECRFAVGRYPRDSVNVNKIYEITDLILQANDGIYYSEHLQDQYVKVNITNNCIKTQLSKPLELLYQPLVKNEKIIGYEVKYNIKGLPINEYFRKYLDFDLLVTFDKEVINQLIFELKSQNVSQHFFVLINPETIEQLLESNKIKLSSLNKHITFIFDIYYPYEKQLINLIESLNNLEFNVGFTFDNIMKYSLNFIKKYVKLVVFVEGDERKVSENIDLIASLNVTVIASNVESNKTQIITRRDDLFPLTKLK